ncbi:MAG: hypothetical protein H6R15_943 [Proteobacteria bacterium]|nr:hypothetical protein [Pseudomonadota bacterium]
MRKRSRRKESAKAGRLTPEEQVELLIAPRVHLDLILARQRNTDYLRSVIGFFDIAIALAALSPPTQQTANYERALAVLETLAHGTAAAEAELDLVRASFNQACLDICREDRRRLTKAMASARQQRANDEFSRPETARKAA